jgi:hypothetical protein
LFAGADSTHVLDLVIRNTERMVVPSTHRSIWSAPSELSFAILDVAAALSRPDLAIAMRPLIFWYGKRPATVLVYPNIRRKQWKPGKNTHAVSSAIIRERVAIPTCARQVSKLLIRRFIPSSVVSRQWRQ